MTSDRLRGTVPATLTRLLCNGHFAAGSIRTKTHRPHCSAWQAAKLCGRRVRAGVGSAGRHRALPIGEATDSLATVAQCDGCSARSDILHLQTLLSGSCISRNAADALVRLLSTQSLPGCCGSLPWHHAVAGVLSAAHRPLPPVATQPAAAGSKRRRSQRAAAASAGPERPPAADPAEPLAEPADGGKLVEETWDAYSMQGTAASAMPIRRLPDGRGGRPEAAFARGNFTRTMHEAGRPERSSRT